MEWGWVEWALHVDIIMVEWAEWAEWAAMVPDGEVPHMGAATEVTEATGDMAVGDMQAATVEALGVEDATVAGAAEKNMINLCIFSSESRFSTVNCHTRQVVNFS
jgi:hypothetical protein